MCTSSTEKLYDNAGHTLHCPGKAEFIQPQRADGDGLAGCLRTRCKLPHYDELDVKTRTVLAINGLDNVKGLEK